MSGGISEEEKKHAQKKKQSPSLAHHLFAGLISDVGGLLFPADLRGFNMLSEIDGSFFVGLEVVGKGSYF